MFDRIHDALDIQPPAGAYERLRTVLIKEPVKPRAWPVLNVRFSKMGFRLAAGLVVVAIAIAAAAAALAIHNASNSSPAGSRMSISAYQALLARNYVDPNTNWANPCDETVHTGCAADATQAIPKLQAWLDALNKSAAPRRFELVDAEMRQHLKQSITALNALYADAQAHNDSAMTRDYRVSLYTADWVSTFVPAIESSQEVTAAAYVQLVGSETRTLNGCGAACGYTPIATNCVRGSGLTCGQYFWQLSASFGGYQVDLIRKAAPSSLLDADMKLQVDLARADTVLLTMNLAVAANDQAGFNSTLAQLRQFVNQIDVDAARITG